MLNDASNRELMKAWQTGDQHAADLLFQRYRHRLFALIRSRMARKLARRVDPEDVLLSAYRSFFVATRSGRVTAGENDDLWPLLLTFAMRKLSHAHRRHSAERRAVDREQQTDAAEAILPADDEPSAEDVAVAMEAVEGLLTQLDPTAREVLVRTLQGDDVETISHAIGLHERSVRRALERVREQLPRDLDQRMPDLRAMRSLPRRMSPTQQGTAFFDQYLLQQFVGAGAFSKVYRAIERTSEEQVAVKFLRRDCWEEPRAIEAMISEFHLLRRLDHPHILKMRHWGTTPRGGLFLVTDFVNGTTLADQKMPTPSMASIIKWMGAVAEAISAAHAEGVLHCDLKPSNVLLRKDGHVVLCDFGLARHASAPDEIPRGGTAGFLCPEQISDAFGPITAKSDVYGLGALFYCLLTGNPPMTGRDLPETLANVLSSKLPVAPCGAGGRSTAELDAIVMRCLQKEPSRRFDSAEEVVRALGAIQLSGRC